MPRELCEFIRHLIVRFELTRFLPRFCDKCIRRMQMIQKDSKTALYGNVLAVLGGSTLFILTCSAPFLIVPILKGYGHIPWMTTPKHICELAFKKHKSFVSSNPHLSSKPLKVIDLGSGDGRLVIAAARQGYHATGFEINPVLFCLSYYNAWQAQVLDKVTFRMSNFWDENLAPYDVVTVFGVESAMPRLVAKIAKESHIGTYLISFRFPAKSIEPVWKDGELYMYQRVQTS